MDRIIVYVFLYTFCLSACETDPVISIPSKPLPVIYAILDDRDSIHEIVIEKSFGATYDPATTAKYQDSLFFEKEELKVFVKPFSLYRNRPWSEVTVYKDLQTHKDSGYFNFPNRSFYYFNSVLRTKYSQKIDSIKITLDIPGYEIIRAKVKILNLLTIARPKQGEHYIYLVPQMPYKVIWDHSGPGQPPHPMNEIDVKFEFIEELATTTRSKYVSIQNILWNTSTTETYREMSITYEELVREILQQIEANDSVLRTFLGDISIHIAGADTNLVQYKRYLNGFSDYNIGSFSNVEGGLGLVTSVTHTYKDSMRFDYETRQTLINENRLKKLKISPWTEAGK